ncbi:hypothetical protein [Nocardia jejuensis]|uniref:hypothetical protein n=1 Tax=Nocardia jejuensis TaxID=328049 RepID=UPI0008372428|nr:hypothetical protein [Nocardia jejuensis]
MDSRWVRRTPLLVTAAAAIALTAACGGNPATTGSSQPQGSSAPLTSSGKPAPSGSNAPNTTKAGDKVTVSDDAAKQLCDMIRPQLSDWRVQGPTLGGIAYNATVHEWAVRNGGINMQVLGDKDVIDRLTTANCSDVRDQAIQALEIPNLATGLAF